MAAMWMLAASIALAGKWDTVNPDIRVERDLPGSPEALQGFIMDLNKLKGITPVTCVGKWEMAPRSEGEGASATVRYDLAALHRTLLMTVTNVEPGRRVDLDHAGNRGFITRWSFAPSPTGAGTHITWLTPINPPPWPFKAYYFETVKPEWERCASATLDALAAAAP